MKQSCSQQEDQTQPIALQASGPDDEQEEAPHESDFDDVCDVDSEMFNDSPVGSDVSDSDKEDVCLK